MLVIADPHFGKAQALREQGIPVPGGATADDFRRLSRLMNEFQPNMLLILGDLIHDRINYSDGFKRQIDEWRRQYRNVQLVLVSGNHDLRSGEPPTEFKFDLVMDEYIIHPFIFTHKPKIDDSPNYGIAGHLHPAVSMAGKGPLKETLPCFSFGSRMALLPAFGTLTGNQVIRPAFNDQIYVIAGEQIERLSRLSYQTLGIVD